MSTEGQGNNLAGSPPANPGETDKQPGIIAVTILVTVLADVVVGLRIIVRRYIVKSLGWDDWTILAAAAGITIGCGLVIVQVHYGFGRHVSNLSEDEYREFMKFSWAEWIQTFATLMFTKVSICFFLLRIVVGKLYTRFLQFCIVALVLSNIVLTVLWIVQCRPDLEDAWQQPETPGMCFSRWQLQAIIFAQAVISIVSDFILAAMPIFILRKVQMSSRIKIGLCFLMGLGVITGIISIVRTVYNWQNINDDPTWHSIWNWHWRSWEVCVGIMTACLPALRPGYTSFTNRMKSYSRMRSEKSDATPKTGSSRPTGEPISLRPRKDVGDVSAVCMADPVQDPVHLPSEETGIIRTTRIDLESQGETSTSPLDIDQELGRMDSKARLRDEGTLV